jgi:hypothetical protein
MFFALISLVFVEAICTIGFDFHAYLTIKEENGITIKVKHLAFAQGIMNLLVGIFIGYLLCFHIWLHFVGKSTYQYIVE